MTDETHDDDQARRDRTGDPRLLQSSASTVSDYIRDIARKMPDTDFTVILKLAEWADQARAKP